MRNTKRTIMQKHSTVITVKLTVAERAKLRRMSRSKSGYGEVIRHLIAGARDPKTHRPTPKAKA